jgi:hypothetical protein
MRVPHDSVGNDCKSVILYCFDQRVGQLLHVPVGVDVAGRLDRFVTQQLLNGLQVAGCVEHIDAVNGRDSDADPWAADAEMTALGAQVSGRDNVTGFIAVFQEAFPPPAAQRLVHCPVADRLSRTETGVADATWGGTRLARAMPARDFMHRLG